MRLEIDLLAAPGPYIVKNLMRRFNQSWLIALFAVVVRLIVGYISDYSGFNNPPKFGDFEAQRHWMELTVNLPPTEWYRNSSSNDISWWPLDYPPLSGYQSWLHGQVLAFFEPKAVELLSSRGYESPRTKLIMRLMVLLSDLLIYFPAAFAAASVISVPSSSSSTRKTKADKQQDLRHAFTLAALLLNPALILIDHGHFQFNCIGLGLALGGAAAIGSGRRMLGSVFFCLSLSHKQMGLFYAPAFFAHLLGWCLHDHKSIRGKLLALTRLGITVILTFFITWLPCLRSPSDLLMILQRIFPVKRGLFEDYVANFWCASSVIIKWKALVPKEELLVVCAAVTLIGAAPSMLHQIALSSYQKKGSTSSAITRGLLLCMACSSMSFFMFSFQVHEKSILLPLLPITALAALDPLLALYSPLVACLSMWPLLHRDGVIACYVAIPLIYLVISLSSAHSLFLDRFMGLAKSSGRSIHMTVGSLVIASCLLLHLIRALIPPPENLPWLHDRAFITFGFGFFGASVLHLNWRQWERVTDKQS